jgi:hypothetical protein
VDGSELHRTVFRRRFFRSQFRDCGVGCVVRADLRGDGGFLCCLCLLKLLQAIDPYVARDTYSKPCDNADANGDTENGHDVQLFHNPSFRGISGACSLYGQAPEGNCYLSL